MLPDMKQTGAMLVADTHLHLYDDYPLAGAMSRLFGNLAALVDTPPGAPVVRIGLLAEAAGCRFHERLAAAGSGPVTAGPEEGSLSVSRDGQFLGFLLAGRQIVTAEKIEVLALAADLVVPDGLPLEKALNAIREGGAVPVLPWGAGKWLGRRGERVRRLIADADPSDFLIGDTSLRPGRWPTPAPMREAAGRGFRVIAGSDPLPFAGDERFMGTYGIACRTDFDPERPVTSLRRILTDAACPLQTVGRRNGPAAFVRRWIRNRLSHPQGRR